MAKIHHLNCATMCPYNARLMEGEGGWTEPAHLVAHVLVIESDDGLVLVDTGLGTADVANPQRTGALFRHLVRLLTPPGGTVLDPFLGSGTTGIACILEGFEWLAIEQDTHYCEIAEARTKAWAERHKQETQQLQLV